MGKTHAQKMKSRESRLQNLPRKARITQSAMIKKKEGRVLDASEKKALKQKGSHGTLIRAWEVLRASADKVEEKLEAMRQQAKMHGADESALALVKEDFTKASGSREAAVEKVLAQLKPKFEDVARTPTASRVIQSCIKFGTNKQREQLLLLMAPEFAQYCSDSSAHFAVEALIRHALKEDLEKITALVMTALRTLATHKCGLRVVSAIYNHRLTSTTERHRLLLGIFKDGTKVMESWKGYPVMEDILDGEPKHRSRLLSVLFAATDKLVSQKEAYAHPFVQRLLCVLFARGTKEQVEETAATIKDHLVVMADSKEGARLASLVLGVLPPRARKVVLQGVAGTFFDLLMGKHTPPFLARCFDLTYDPQMASKFLVGPLVENIGPACGSPYGCRVVLHLFTPDAERKARVMFTGYDVHNLYSRGNASWNHHTWYIENEAAGTFTPETVEICPKSAEVSHLAAAVGPVTRAFLDVVCKPELLGITEEQIASRKHDAKNAEEAAQRKRQKTLKQFVALISAEMLHMYRTDAAYKAAMALSEEDVKVLASLQSEKGRNDVEDDVEEEEDDEAPVAAATPAKSNTRSTPRRAVGSKSERPTSTPKGQAGVEEEDQSPARSSVAGGKAARTSSRRVAASPASAATPVRGASTAAATNAGATGRKSLPATPQADHSVVLNTADEDDDDVPIETSAALNVEPDMVTPSPSRRSRRRKSTEGNANVADSPAMPAAPPSTPAPRSASKKTATTPRPAASATPNRKPPVGAKGSSTGKKSQPGKTTAVDLL